MERRLHFFKRFSRRLASQLASQAGQGLTEYIFLVVLVALVCIPMAKLLPDAIRGYIRPFYYCLSRPIP